MIERGNAVLGFGYILCVAPTLNFSNALRILKRILPECFCTSLKNIYHGNDWWIDKSLIEIWPSWHIYKYLKWYI